MAEVTDRHLQEIYGKKVRVRTMGLLMQSDKLLMINHTGMNASDELWLPPGGGVEFGATLGQSLIREFKEETGLSVKIGPLLFFHEFISTSLHAIEFFYQIDGFSGEVKLGADPELGPDQILSGIKFMDIQELKSKGTGHYHRVFDSVGSYQELFEKRGIFQL